MMSGYQFMDLPAGDGTRWCRQPNSVKWVSKYGSVVASGYDVSTTDGINEKDCPQNLLWLVESVYPTPESNKPTLSISARAQYVLDNYATVEEAVTALEKSRSQ